MMEELVSGERTVVFIANDPAHITSTSCNPVNEDASCMYYLSIEGIDDFDKESSFLISAITPDNLAVIPCRPTPAPDGVITWGQDNVRNELQGYEVCGTDLVPNGWLDVTLEVCSGGLAVRICEGDNACDGIIPMEDDYSVVSTFDQTCYAKDGAVPYCEDNDEGQLPSVRVKYANADTYFLSVEGTGSYNLWVGSYKLTDYTPIIKPNEDKVKISRSGDSLSLSWEKVKVFMSGIDSGVEAPLVDYEVYYVKTSLLNAKTEQYKGTEYEINLLSRCALQHMVDIVQPDINVDINTNDFGMVYVENHDANPTGYEFKNIAAGEEFSFFVVAKCDAQCLDQISAIHPSSNNQCTSANPCKTIYGLFSPTEGKREGGGVLGGGGGTLMFVFIALVAILVGIGGGEHKRGAPTCQGCTSW